MYEYMFIISDFGYQQNQDLTVASLAHNVSPIMLELSVT